VGLYTLPEVAAIKAKLSTEPADDNASPKDTSMGRTSQLYRRTVSLKNANTF
jgi:hypothetical protein